MILARPERPPDWADTVSGRLRGGERRARDVFEDALSVTPAWLGAMMVVRNILVRPLGLTTSVPGDGHFLTRMPVVVDEETHYETGIEDRHLTFTLATRLRGATVHLTTAIWFHGLAGRLYLAAVLPGHILAVRQIVDRVAENPVRRHGEPAGAFS